MAHTAPPQSPLIPSYAHHPRPGIDFRRAAKRLAIAAAVLLSLVTIVVLTGPRLYYSYLARHGISNLQSDPRGFMLHHTRPTAPMLVFILNTFDNEFITNDDLRSVYRQTAASLTARTGFAPTYALVTDSEGWDFLLAVWQLPDGYAQLSIGSGNDNNNVHLVIAPGIRPPTPTEKPSSPAAMSSIFVR